ncbi:MAG: hypothetical protein P1U68_16300 [Verrucomicrobiales bacterium]|nr:hypothetical protein [Verrucomicrobiales bacterium]
MIENFLSKCLHPVLEAEIQLRRRRVTIAMLVIGAMGVLILLALAVWADWWSWPVVLGWLALLSLASIIGIIRAGKTPDLRPLAQQVEENHPDLEAALLAAMDQKTAPGEEPSFLQKRLISEISDHALKHQWVRAVSAKKLTLSAWGQFASVIGFCLSIWFLLGYAPGARPLATVDPLAPVIAPTEAELAKLTVSVSPGDVEIEKGSRLAIEASFPDRAPASAMLVVSHADDERKIPMDLGLDDSVFSALLPSVTLPGRYEIRFEGKRSDDYAIEVFEFPALVQADALITPPAYLKQDPIEKLDTQKIVVMEGSQVEWRIRVNKPLAAAELFGEDKTTIPLLADPADPTLLTAGQHPLKSQRYRLHLVDDHERANKRPPWFSVKVKRNEPPELKVTFPGRDFDVSAVQELPVEGEAWDDVQIEQVGFVYQLEDEETEIVLSNEALDGGTTHDLSTFIDIENLEAEPRDLITYYFWAEDLDSEGNLRRTTSDMFFAEVRFFEEIVREGQPQSGQPGQPQGDAGELLKLQKEIINAAWKLRRYHDLNRPFESLAGDLDVVSESQGVVLTMVDPVLQKVEDPELKTIYEEAKVLMQQALDEFLLVSTKRDGALIDPAHQTARAVFAKLIEARQRETEISMSKQPSQGQGSQREQRNMNLELKQNELKYEEQSFAQQEQATAEQKENLAVLSRLKELARRQEAIAEKIKELEEQLQNSTHEERTEIERQLKRLQEEQRELLRETDDLSERMDSEENRANMSEEREQLEKTRENIQETAENLESGDLADAANSATRAREELEQMEEQFRERTSRQFAEELRGLRETARELAENQERIGESLNELAGSDREVPPTTGKKLKQNQLAESISNQANELEELVDELKTLSEQAEASEPILSDSLYDAVRNATMNGVHRSLEETRDYTYYNSPTQALAPQEAATRGIEELKENVEAAAEKILGNEADALRLARSELDRLIEDSREEANRLAKNGAPSQEAKTGEASAPGQDEPTGEPSPAASGEGKPGRDEEGTEPGEEPGSGQGEAKGEMAGRGESPGEGETPGAGDTPGEQSGKGKGSGKMAGKGDSPGEGEGGQAGEGRGKGKAPLAGNGQPGEGGGDSSGESGEPGKGQGKGPGQEEGQNREGSDGQSMAGSGSRKGSGSLSMGGDDRGSGMPSGSGKSPTPLFFNQPSEQPQSGPITGEGYKEFRDRLGNIEEMIPQEDLRNQAARVADDARQMRVDFSRDNLPPEAASIDQRITQPLIELRQRLSEEIAKLNRENPISPIDRDPVPSEFRDLVRRYYEELGSGN